MMELIILFSSLLGDTFLPAHEVDKGGFYRDYVERVERLNRTGQTFAIPLYCASGCTLYLGARGACVRPEVRFRFHGPGFVGGADGPEYALERTRREMMRIYPQQLRSWVAQSGALSTRQFTELSGQQVIAMGAGRPCNQGAVR